MSIVDATSLDATAGLAKASSAAWESVNIFTFFTSDCFICMKSLTASLILLVVSGGRAC